MPTYVTAIREVNNDRFVVRWMRNAAHGMFYIPDSASDADCFNSVNTGFYGNTGTDTAQIRNILYRVAYIGNPLCAWPNMYPRSYGPRIRLSIVDSD